LCKIALNAGDHTTAVRDLKRLRPPEKPDAEFRTWEVRVATILGKAVESAIEHVPELKKTNKNVKDFQRLLQDSATGQRHRTAPQDSAKFLGPGAVSEM